MNKTLVIICGNAGAGKDTLGDYMRVALEPRLTVAKDAYARTIKNILRDSLAVPTEVLNSAKNVKETTYIKIADTKTDITVRAAMQEIGEFFRQRFGKLVWANSVRRRLLESACRVYIVTDGRHPEEEIHWMRSHCESHANVVIVRIRNSRVPVKRGHPSEDKIADEPDSSFDFIVDNEGTLMDLKDKAERLIDSIPSLKTELSTNERF